MKRIIYLLVLVLFSGLCYAVTTLTDCGNVSASNTQYELANNIDRVSCLEYCFDINASNVTIDFQNYWINMSNGSCIINGVVHTFDNYNVTLRNLNTYMCTTSNCWTNVYSEDTKYLEIYDSSFYGGAESLYTEGPHGYFENITSYTNSSYCGNQFYFDWDNITINDITITGECGYSLLTYGENIYIDDIFLNRTDFKFLQPTGIYSYMDGNYTIKNIEIHNYWQNIYLDYNSGNVTIDNISSYNSVEYSQINFGSEYYRLDITNAYFPDYGIETYYTGVSPSVFDAYVNFTNPLASEDFSIWGRTLILNHNGRTLYRVFNATSGLYPCDDVPYCEINQTRYSQYVVSARINDTASEEPYFDIWGLLFEDLLGSMWLVVIVGLIITFYFSVSLNLSFQISILSGMLWIAVVSAITINIFLWALVVLVAGTLFYFMVSQKLRRN